MKKTIFLSIILTLAFCATAKAQQTPVTKADYDMAERFSPAKINRMVYSQIIRPYWFKESDKFWYEWKDSEGSHYYIVDPLAKKKTSIFDLEKLAMQLTEIVKDPFDAQHIPFRKLKLKDDRTFTFEIQSTMEEKAKKDDKDNGKKERKKGGKKVFRFEYDIASRTLKDVTENEEEKDFPRWANIAPDSSYVVYGKNYNIFYTDMENLRKFMKDEKDSTFVEHRLTTDGTKDIPYGGDSEMGLNEEDTAKRYRLYILWSPDSKYFVTDKFDFSKTGELWVINSTASPRPKLETYKYQMPGEPSPKSYVMLFDMSEKSGRTINLDAFKDQNVFVHYQHYKKEDIYAKYVASKWLGDDNSFYFTRLSRDLHRVDHCIYNIAGDSVQVLIKERLNTYIDVTSFELVENTGEMVVMSERNGWSQLYLHDKDGNLKNPITKRAFHVSKIEGVDSKARVVYFTATGYNRNENPYYHHLFRINLNGSGLKMLNPGNFDNKTSMPLDHKFFVSGSSRVDTTPTNALFANNGLKIMDLETADFSQLMLTGYKFPETFKVKAADGITDLYGVMYKPFDFDSTKLYPVIEYVYPGPQTEATNYFWSARMNRIDRLAQLGFIVITVGQRGGHPDRSKWYHNFGYGNMRDYPLADHKYAIQQLCAQHKYMDVNKVGIHGHSGGGFMSTAAILTYPDFYKVAVSCAGNHDNRIYNRWWSETHHGVKETVTEKGDTVFNYSIKTNQELAKNLKGRLLLVHGDIDNNVHPANTLRVVDALIRANKRFDMLFLPGQRHGFGDMDEYFFWKMADYFSRYLIGDYENSVDIRQLNND